MNWWTDLSVSKKLYTVVGIMALLIATELGTLLFAMDKLSAVRSFVGGEGLWSKSQKNAIHSLHRYATTHDPRFWAEYQGHLRVPLGDRIARLEMEKADGDMRRAAEGFIQGGNHPEDVEGLIQLIRRFYWVDYIGQAIVVWQKADEGLNELMRAGELLHEAVTSRPVRTAAVDDALARVDRVNEELTVLEKNFSDVLGAGSRWLESMVMYILLIAVLTVESTGLFLTILFSRNLNRSLVEMTDAAAAVGRGDFSARVPVRSKDELGQLASSVNRMAQDLETSFERRRQAESASQSKSQFLANMSHEIRTPLGVILGLTEILKDPSLSWTDRQSYVETVERTGQDLTRIINDILDLSKVESGHLDIERTNFSLPDLIAELNAMLQVRADSTHNRLEFEARGEIPRVIESDRTRLRQILVNLINNALKFTHNGTVRLVFGREGSDLVFDVIDTGSGIRPGDEEKIFEAFRQSDGETHEKGTGLGLMLARKLAQALGGDVSLVRTVPGEGSAFRARIACHEIFEPIAESRAAIGPTSPAAIGAPTGSVKALVVEDSEDNRLLVKLYLSRRGIRTEFAVNGLEGVERALSGDFDVVLMDMQMPVMDGYRATEELRARRYQRPIIALTAHAMKEDRERCLKAGCNDYLTKPIDSDLLYKTIMENLARGSAVHPPELTV